MEEWFFFDRIDMYSAWIAVSDGIKLVLNVYPVAAFAGFHAFKRTVVRAVCAFNAACSYFIMVGFATPFPKRVY